MTLKSTICGVITVLHRKTGKPIARPIQVSEEHEIVISHDKDCHLSSTCVAGRRMVVNEMRLVRG